MGYTEEVSLNGVSVWSNAQQNDRGQFTQFHRADGHVLHQEYDYHGFPTRSHADDFSIHDRTYRFDAASGNLEIRSDNRVSGYDWAMFYDNQNRLQSWYKARTTGESPEDGANVVSGTIQLMTLSYAANGNIISKTDIGDYSYGLSNTSSSTPTAMIHAVSEVTDPADIAGPDHIATYTGFNSLSDITQGDRQYDLHYGPDNQRSRSVMSLAGVQQYERIYAGNYERQTMIDGSTQEVYYISAPSGMAAIYVIEDSGQGEIYTPYQDHLGSIVTITDDNGDILLHAGQEVRMDFDPWGRHRDAATWDYETVSPLVDGSMPDWLWRGYTGHEHLDEFGLINMNGRCYDPLNGRMLSVDNYVSDATSTQAYNRYSYVLNNPLKYTDPSGELVALAVVGVGMLISAATYTASVAMSSGGMDNFSLNSLVFSAVKGGIAAGVASIIGGVSSGFQGADYALCEAKKAGFQAIAHAGFGGAMGMTEGTGGAGALSGGISSLVGSGVGLSSSNWRSGRAAATIAAGGLTGGLGAVIGGGNFWTGARNGLIVAGLNHAAHSVSQEAGDRKKARQLLEKHNKNEDKILALSLLMETVMEATTIGEITLKSGREKVVEVYGTEGHQKINEIHSEFSSGLQDLMDSHFSTDWDDGRVLSDRFKLVLAGGIATTIMELHAQNYYYEMRVKWIDKRTWSENFNRHNIRYQFGGGGAGGSW